jgi:AcrR family transcriptional regulator
VSAQPSSSRRPAVTRPERGSARPRAPRKGSGAAAAVPPRRKRKEKALATRRRILRAAHALFATQGYASTTMEAIAARAEVAVQTLYFTFHTKGAILSEAFGAAILGFERWDPVVAALVTELSRPSLRELHPWFAAFERETDLERALRLLVGETLEILTRAGPLSAVFTAAAISDPEVRAALQQSERRRVDTFTVLVDVLAEKRSLRRGVTKRRATDVLLTLLSPDVHQQLTRGRGWSAASCRQFLLEVVAQQLFDAGAGSDAR